MTVSPAPPADSTGPTTVSEALTLARGHTQAAGFELLAAARALLDAASLGVTGQPAKANAALTGIARGLDDLGGALAQGSSGVPAPVIDAILAALDSEIGRWEKRSGADAEARAVLRTFLGLREILWEFGLRPSDDARASRATGDGSRRSTRRAGGGAARPTRASESAPPDAPATAAAPRDRPRRVQRIKVEG